MRFIITLNILSLVSIFYLIRCVNIISDISNENKLLMKIHNKNLDYMNDMLYDQNKKINQAYDTLIKRKNN
jgi:hypothetical protein